MQQIKRFNLWSQRKVWRFSSDFRFSCLRNRTTLRIDFLHSLIVCAPGTWVDWWLINKNIMSLSPLHFCLPFGFAFMRMRRWDFLKFQDSVHQKAEVWAQTINKWRISKCSVVLEHRQGFFCVNNFDFKILFVNWCQTFYGKWIIVSFLSIKTYIQSTRSALFDTLASTRHVWAKICCRW